MRVLLAFALIACSKHEDPIQQGNPRGETKEQVVAEVQHLEAAAKRGEVEWSRTDGHDLVALRKDGTTLVVPFPAPKHGHGDSVNGMWMAPDGTLFTVGYMITGVPGPDTGAIHRYTPGGKLERVFEVPERELWGIWGRTASDIYAIGPKIVLHFDGTTWTELPIPGITHDINAVGGNATDVWIEAVNNNPERSQIYRLVGGTWKQEADVPCLLRGLGAGPKIAYAAGACDAVFRRDPDGHWKHEKIPRGGAYDIAVVSDSDAYLAAEELLHRAPDGTWKAVETPWPRVHTVERAQGDLVFAIGNIVQSGGDSGVAVGARDRWTKLALGNCKHAAASDSGAYCVRERTVRAEPPEDLRPHQTAP
jgi:hypothetical protein